jgi:hypothetical protein
VLRQLTAAHAALRRLPPEAGLIEAVELLTRQQLLALLDGHTTRPALRAALPDGEQLTLRNEFEHQQINQLWSELDHTPAGSARRRELVAQLTDLLHQDARDEEDLLLPRLQQACTVQQLRRLGSTWQLLRRTAPTRPHPHVSRRPPGNVVSGLPLAALDRTRDLKSAPPARLRRCRFR